jgi:hypothetical protein
VAIEEHRLPHDRRIAAILALPERIAQHHARCATALDIIGWRDQPAGGRPHAEHREEIAADPEGLRQALLAALREVDCRRAERHDVGEDLLLLENLLIERVCQRRPASVEGPRAAVARFHDADFGQLLGPIDRQRPEPQRVDELEDCGIGAGPERERDNGDGRERWITAEQPRAISEILPERFEEADRVHGVDLLADPRRVSQLAVRGGARLLGRHAARDVVVDLVREMRVDLSRALVVPVPSAEEAAEAHGLLLGRGTEDPVDGTHQLVPAGGLRLELLAALRGQAVVAGAAVVLGGAPEARDPAAVLEPVQRGIERSVLDLKNIFRTVLDRVGDGVPVRGPQRQRLEHEHVEGPLEHVPLDRRCPALRHA